MAEEAKLAPKISIQAQYVRDLSFENVAVQSGDGKLDAKPDIQVGVNLDAKKRSDDQFEVILKVNATAKSGDAVMFIVELEYAGIFRVENVPEQQLHPVLLIECPRILFPIRPPYRRRRDPRWRISAALAGYGGLRRHLHRRGQAPSGSRRGGKSRRRHRELMPALVS